MLVEDIYFNQETHFLGRNGNFKSSGVCVELNASPTLGEGTVYLTPFTSKGLLGRCRIEIPVESAADLISALRWAIKEAKRKE